ncbi:hypothetical protein [Pedobacter foliorum]|uniref:hypothetical protein n=1 Tax=Pedobacter foliorum TaxID=2739058 RepID=UPI0015671171|nr:hypothetical protein [Pedobacter foliorum]NRF41805.1 hypothetical protein [Pedobacter foliorum]
MRKSALYLALIALPLAFSCTQGGNKTSELKDSTKMDTADAQVSKECFIAIDGVDTAHLNVVTSAQGKVTGGLVIKYLEKGTNDGLIAGKFSGDTLFVDYTFKIGTNKTIYKNPLALLKKDGKLVLGVGQIETSLGKSYFVKGKPINFERGRFTFAPTECK